MRFVVLTVLLALPACGEMPPPASPPPPPPPRVVSVLDALRGDDALRIHADARQLRQVALPEIITAWATRRADVELGLQAAAAACGFQPLLAVDEVFVGVRWAGAGGAVEGAAVARLERPVEELERCLPPFAIGAQEFPLDGRRAWHIGGVIVTSREGFLIVASSVEEVRGLAGRLARPSADLAAQRAALTGALATVQLFGLNPYGVTAGSARWAAASPGSLLDLRGSFSEEAMARRIQRLVTDGLAQARGSSASFDPSASDLLGELAQGTHLERRGPELAVTMKVPALSGHGGVVSQLVGLTLRGVREYFAGSRAEEARERVFAIGDALVKYVTLERERGAKKVTFPESAPLVPSQIPSGKVVEVSATSFGHPSWQAIGFSHTGTVHYACDFVTGKDGRSVLARARGDLDGDGLTSLFELELKLDGRGRPVVDPTIRERDADE